jgi:hypothetical protein
MRRGYSLFLLVFHNHQADKPPHIHDFDKLLWKCVKDVVKHHQHIGYHRKNCQHRTNRSTQHFNSAYISCQTENPSIADLSALFGFKFSEIVPIRIRFEYSDIGLSAHKYKPLQLQSYLILFQYHLHFSQRFTHVFATNIFEYQINFGDKRVVKKPQEIAYYQN